MCNACGFFCCAWDGFSGCGCDHCPNPECWSEEDDLDDPDYECDYDDEDNDDEDNEMVFDCGLEGCLMPGEHFRHECHTAEMLEDMYREHESSPLPSVVQQGKDGV